METKRVRVMTDGEILHAGQARHSIIDIIRSSTYVPLDGSAWASLDSSQLNVDVAQPAIFLFR